MLDDYEIDPVDLIVSASDLYPFKIFNNVKTVKDSLRYPLKSFDEI
jgi:hypothetical protein